MDINTGFNGTNTGGPKNSQESTERDPLILDLQRCWKALQSLMQKIETFVQREGISTTIRDTMNQAAMQQFADRVREMLARDYSRILNASASEEKSGASAQTGQPRSTSGKRLCRIEKGKTIAGVCTGVADYFELDISLVRVGFILAGLLYGMGLIAYIALLIILPIKSTPEAENRF